MSLDLNHEPESLYDNDVMPFGKHKGENLSQVPSSYFLWLWDDGYWRKTSDPLHQYIKTGLQDMMDECPGFEFKHYEPIRRKK